MRIIAGTYDHKRGDHGASITTKRWPGLQRYRTEGVGIWSGHKADFIMPGCQPCGDYPQGAPIRAPPDACGAIVALD
ncbi:MAG: hypothetical protein ACLR0U_00285 [Enterocloster clostridioformis]